MKLSTKTLQQQPVTAMLKQQETVNKVQKQLASGKKILQPSDDPAGMTRANQLRDSMRRSTQYIRNGDNAESKVNLEETIVDSMTNVVQRIRELSVQVLSGTYNDTNRRAVGNGGVIWSQSKFKKLSNRKL